MRMQVKAFAVSISVHMLIAMTIIGVSYSMSFISARDKVISLDFSIEKISCQDRQPEVISKKRQEKTSKEKTAPIAQKTEEAQKPPQDLPVTPSVSEEQAALEAPKIEEKPSHTQPSETQHESVSHITEVDNTNTTEEARVKYVKEHFAYIKDIIMKNLSYPLIARRMGLTGKVVVSFVIYENGHVGDIQIKQVSGVAILDKNAVETIKKAAPFPKPPVKAEMIIPIVYELK
ncbi:MAG: energy transducer TonB [bacterium]